MSPKELNLGNLLQHHKAAFEFNLKNNGSEVIVIDKVDWSCGCTQAKTDKVILDAGESTAVHGTLDAGSKLEGFKSTIEIIGHTKSGRRVTATAVAIATAVSAAEVQPRLLDFGTMMSGEKIKPQIVVVKKGKANINWDDIKIYSETNELRIEKTRLSDDSFAIAISPIPQPNTICDLSDLIHFQLLSHQKPLVDGLYSIPVSARYVMTGIKINPRSIYLGLMGKHSQKAITIEISSLDDISTAIGQDFVSTKAWSLNEPKVLAHELIFDGSIISPEKTGDFCYRKSIPFHSDGGNCVAIIAAYGYADSK
jgi:hypothetical protein